MLFSTLLTVALFAAPAIQSVAAQFTVPTIELVQCQQATLTFDATQPPYHVYIVGEEEPCAEELFYVGQVNTNTVTFNVPIPENTRVQLYVESADNQEGWSGGITVARSGDASCVLPDLIANGSDDHGAPANNTPQGPSNVPTNPTPSGAPQGTPSIAPVGAANAGVLGGSDSSAAPSSRHLSVSAVALGALVAFAL